MVATKKTVTMYGRRRYARGYRRYRNVSNVYFPCRVEGVFTIAFPNTYLSMNHSIEKLETMT